MKFAESRIGLCASCAAFCCHKKFGYTCVGLEEEDLTDPVLMRKMKEHDVFAYQVDSMGRRSYRMNFGESGSCVFLENGRCSIYQNRPVSCRNVFCGTESNYKVNEFVRSENADWVAFMRKSGFDILFNQNGDIDSGGYFSNDASRALNDMYQDGVLLAADPKLRLVSRFDGKRIRLSVTCSYTYKGKRHVKKEIPRAIAALLMRLNKADDWKWREKSFRELVAANPLRAVLIRDEKFRYVGFQSLGRLSKRIRARKNRRRPPAKELGDAEIAVILSDAQDVLSVNSF